MKRIALTLLTSIMGAASASQPLTWAVTHHEYEGFPLFTRYPKGLNYESLQKRYPNLIVATLIFEEVKDNGLPVTSYNNTLEPLDVFITDYFVNSKSGICVLVETFGGKRGFYIYISPMADVAAFEAALKGNFPQHKISIEEDNDRNWSFIKKYAKNYLGG